MGDSGHRRAGQRRGPRRRLREHAVEALLGRHSGLERHDLGDRAGTPKRCQLAGCPDEDINHNGVLDAGRGPERQRTDRGRQHRAGVPDTDVGGSTVTTDKNGFALVDVFYPQAVRLLARGRHSKHARSVQGTEFSERATFVPARLGGGLQPAEHRAAPGVFSPFGTDGNLRHAAAAGRPVRHTPAITSAASTKKASLALAFFFSAMRKARVFDYTCPREGQTSAQHLSRRTDGLR